MSKKRILLFGIGALVFLVPILIIVKFRDNGTSHKKAVAAEVALVEVKDMPFVIELPGVVEASATVAIRSRVDGQLIKVNCQDGQYVKTGDSLFEIDNRSFAHQLEQAEANLLKDQAALENAIKEEKRYSALLDKKAISEEQYQNVKATMDSLVAATAGDKALIENAKLQIEYSKITAPIDGKLGEINFDLGNIITANSQVPLATINTISPVNVAFSAPEKYLSHIRNSFITKELSLVIKTSSGSEIKDGSVFFIDNTVDASSGTIKLKALVPNKDEKLWPGEFIRVLLSVYNKKDAIVVPSVAVQANQDGTYVFVVSSENKAQIRKVEVDFANEIDTVISAGLKIGETVVINGQSRLAEGISVLPENMKEGR
jgi:multidrug efflux system membrane fusion protein